jgi:hypothetical protein
MLEFELVLPCYNEANSLPNILERAALTAAEAGYDPDRFQLVLVDNGSRDNSAAVLSELKQGPLGVWFRPVTVPVNQGYGFGIMSGLRTTTAPYIGWSHADQQCDPRDAFEALSKVLRAFNPSQILVKGMRNGRSAKERLVSRVYEGLSRIILGLRVFEMNAQPKVFSRNLLTNLVDPPNTFAFDLYVLYQACKQGWAIQTIPVDFPPRVHGFSNWAHGYLRRYKTILGMVLYMRKLAHSEGRL